MISVKKLDRRYNGFGTFTHRVEFSGREGGKSFVRARAWAMERFGPGSEIQHITWLVDPPKWAWESEHNWVLYLKDECLTEFLLIKEKFNE